MDQDRFYRLLDQAEAQDGMQADGACVGTELKLKHSPKPIKTHGCMHQMRLLVPYELEPALMAPTSVESYVTVCAIGDMVDQWPRFAEAE